MLLFFLAKTECVAHVRFFFLPDWVYLVDIEFEILLIVSFLLKIKRCGEMARKLRFFRDQMTKAGLVPADRSTAEAIASLDDLEVSLAFCKCFVCYVIEWFIRSIISFQVKLGELEAELVEINANGDKLQRSYNELAEYKLVLQKVLFWFFSVLIAAFLSYTCYIFY